MIIDMSNLQRVHKSGDSASRLCCQERAHLLKTSITTSGLCLAGITYRNRRVAEIEDGNRRLTVTQEGGHVAQILHKASLKNQLRPWAA